MSDCFSNSDCHKYYLCEQVTKKCTPCQQFWCSPSGITSHGVERCKQKCIEYWEAFIRTTPLYSSDTAATATVDSPSGGHKLVYSLIVTAVVLVVIIFVLIVRFCGIKYWRKWRERIRRNYETPTTLQEVETVPVEPEETMPCQPEYPGGEPEEVSPEDNPEQHKLVTARQTHASGSGHNPPFRRSNSANAA